MRARRGEPQSKTSPSDGDATTGQQAELARLRAELAQAQAQTANQSAALADFQAQVARQRETEREENAVLRQAIDDIGGAIVSAALRHLEFGGAPNDSRACDAEAPPAEPDVKNSSK